MRDLLTGQVDLNVTSQRFFTRNRFLRDDPDRFGRRFWNYGEPGHPRDSNVAMRAWVWRVWIHGGDGVVPWNTISVGSAWDRAEPLTMFYPGSKFNHVEPLPSLRLKALRRGQQDAEYLALLAQKSGWDRDAVSHVVAEAGETDWETLRMRVARALMEP
jgi:hypothetical protein